MISMISDLWNISTLDTLPWRASAGDFLEHRGAERTQNSNLFSSSTERLLVAQRVFGRTQAYVEPSIPSTSTAAETLRVTVRHLTTDRRSDPAD